jgi:tetratricopeptide (TPR) repeat protein
MNRIIEIAADTIFSLFGAGFVGWLFWRALKRSDDPEKILFKSLFSTALVIGEVFFIRHLTNGLHEGGVVGNFAPAFLITTSVAMAGIVLSIVWTPQISEFLFKPLTSLYDGGDEPPEPKPFYSIAQAKRKRGEFLDAALEVRKQLDRFPNHYEGVMLLAAIQAEDLRDLAAAENTLKIFCDSPDSPPLQIAAALTQLADWHLKIAQEVDPARGAFEKIIKLFPHTIQAAQAAQRIAHLGEMGKILLESQNRQPMAVPEGIKNVGLLNSSEHLIPVDTDPEKMAADFVKHLEQHPLDTEAREKLAVIYAGHYQRLDLAAGELEQLIEMPDQLPKRTAHWLNLLADLQMHHGADYDTIRKTLERIVEKFPELPVAKLAESRLNHLKLEIKGKKETPGKQLGVYEQNIGLKGDRFFSPRQL